MTVQQLIEKLQQFNPETTVVVNSSNQEMSGALIEADALYPARGYKSESTFMDMFDGTRYNKKTYKIGEAPLTHDIIVIVGH